MGYFFSLSKAATETGLTTSEIAIFASGALLLFGALGEYLEEHNKLPRFLHWPKIVFISIVVVSLTGEFLGDGGVFSEHLQTLADNESQQLQSATAKALKSAGEANERAKGFEARIAESNAEAKRASELAERESLARVRIEERLRPRILSAQQARTICSAISPFAGTSIELSAVTADVDGTQYMQQFAKMLIDCGWKVPHRGALMTTAPAPVGLTITEEGEQFREPGHALAKALNDARIEVREEYHPFVISTGQQLTMLVGIKL